MKQIDVLLEILGFQPESKNVWRRRFDYAATGEFVIILSKLIDEDRDPNAILDFQWFPNKDTAEDIIDRHQRLYKRGMKETLGEEITYYEERDIDRAFMAHRRDMAKNEVKKMVNGAV